MSGQVVVLADYQGLQVSFTGEAWFNATAVASRFGKRPAEWLRLPETKRYVKALAKGSKVGKSHFARTQRGGSMGGGGTWLHPKLAIRFAQWLDADFAVWCDEQIEHLLHGRPTIPAGLLAQRIAFEAKRASSEKKGSIGGSLLRERQLEKPALEKEASQWKLTMEPGLFPALEKAA